MEADPYFCKEIMYSLLFGGNSTFRGGTLEESRLIQKLCLEITKNILH